MIWEYSISTWLVIGLAAYLSGVLHGATGMAGGIVMTAILSQFVGIKVAIPIMTVALLLSHSSRVYLYWQYADRKVTARVLYFGTPSLIVGAYFFSMLSSYYITLIFLCFLILSFPIKYYAHKNNIKTGPKLLASASTVWGALAGNVVGPGFFIAPFLLGTGLNKQAFVGTMACITLVMNSIKVVVFSSTEVLDSSIFIVGLVIGIITIPGNWLGKKLLMLMDNDHHRRIIDIMTLLIIVNFLYLL